MPTVNVTIADVADPVVIRVDDMGIIAGRDGRDGAPGADGFSPTVEVEEIEGAAVSGIGLEGDAGFMWLLPEGSGASGDIVLEDESGTVYHIPAGSAESGEVAVTDESGNTWHIPINEAARDGHKITVTDKDGEHVFYVWDGRDGSGSSGGGSGGGGGTLPDGGTNGQYLVKDSTAPGGARWADLPVFAGTWSVTPLVEAETTLHTAGNYLDRDIVVEAIPYAEVSNPTGGMTATIGG